MKLSTHGLETHRNHKTVPTHFQIFGERSTGTHIVGRYLMRHLELKQIHDYGWKHGFPAMTAAAPNHLFVVTFRNALDWVRSMHSKPWHCSADLQRQNFSQFIRSPWDCVVDHEGHFPLNVENVKMAELQLDRHPLTGKKFRNILALRNSKQRAQLGLRNRNLNVLLVQMEAAVQDPVSFLKETSVGFGLPEPKPFRPIEKRLGSRFRPLVEERPTTPKVLTTEDRSFVLEKLNLDMEAEIGYHYD